MEIDVRIKIGLPMETAAALDIDDESVLESYYEDGFIYIRKLSDEEVTAESDDCDSDCDNCEMLCPHCGHCCYDD